jgi:hypothetical protein
LSNPRAGRLARNPTPGANIVSDAPLRNRSTHQFSFAVAAALVIVGVVCIVGGIYSAAASGQVTYGIVGVLGGIVQILFALLLNAVVAVFLREEANVNRIHQNTLDLVEVAHRLEPLVKAIADNSRISDAARSISHREQEREALRQAIREETFSGDWEAAHYLIDQMERRFGYMQEAKGLRTELNQVRDMTIEDKIKDVLSHIDTLMNENRWDRARQESERLMKLFPRHERVLGLPGELSRRREARKQELLGKWRVCVERNEIDNGIVILTELDQYVTSEEAQALRDSARHVFKARLLNLGVQFSLAVSESRWRDALEAGLQLRQEFPNSRMAQEVAEKLDILRVRAGFVTDAEVIQKRASTPAG